MTEGEKNEYNAHGRLSQFDCNHCHVLGWQIPSSETFGFLQTAATNQRLHSGLVGHRCLCLNRPSFRELSPPSTRGNNIIKNKSVRRSPSGSSQCSGATKHPQCETSQWQDLVFWKIVLSIQIIWLYGSGFTCPIRGLMVDE